MACAITLAATTDKSNLYTRIFITALNALVHSSCNVNHKLQSVESVRVELGEEERIFVGWRRICPFSDRHKV